MSEPQEVQRIRTLVATYLEQPLEAIIVEAENELMKIASQLSEKLHGELWALIDESRVTARPLREVLIGLALEEGLHLTHQDKKGVAL